MYIPNKKKKKNKKNFQVSPPPPSSSTSKKNEETAQMLLSNRPNSDIQSTYPSNRYFHLSRKILDKPGIQPERETVPTLLNDPGVTAGKARRLSLSSNERATDRFLEASTSRFTYDTHEPLVSMRGIRERPRLVAMSKAMRAAHVAAR